MTRTMNKQSIQLAHYFRRVTLFRCIVLGIFIISLGALRAQNAAEVINKHLEAIGGNNWWRQLRSLEIKGVVATKLQGPYIQKQPDINFHARILHRVGLIYENEAKGRRTIQLITPKGMWEVAEGQQPFRTNDTPDHRNKLYDLQGEFVDYHQKGHIFTLKKRSVKVNKVSCYVLKGVLSDKSKVIYYISKADYMLIQTKTYPSKKAQRQKNARTTIRTFSDFRTIAGYVFPFKEKIAIAKDSSITQDITITALKPNSSELSPLLFTPKGIASL